MDIAAPLPPRPARRAAVLRRALRRELVRIREPRRILAMALLIVAFGTALAAMLGRGSTAGADAQAYWAAVRIWLEGGDPYNPRGPFLPYVYAPWMLPLFVPWALLPWDVAWFAWRGGQIAALLWSIHWAYGRRPLATAILVALLTFPMAANLDTGNINLLLALAVFAAQFTGPRVGGLLWGLATSMKWIPAPLWLVLPPATRRWGLAWLLLAALLSLVMLPLTIVQLQALFGFGERPFRADYLVFAWAIVPWWWRLQHPFAFLDRAAWRRAIAAWRGSAARWARALRGDPRTAGALAWSRGRRWARRFLGLEPTEATDRRSLARRAARRRAEAIGD